MPRKSKPTTRERRAAAYDAHAAGNPKPLKNIGLKPIPDSFKGPAKGTKNGTGRPRTGNKAIEMDRLTGTEIGKSHAHLDHAYNRFLEGIEENDLQMALATQPGPSELRKNKYQQALNLLTAPWAIRQSKRGTGKPGAWSTAAILKHAGITLTDLMDMYGRYRVSQAVRIAMDRSPKIITHAADDAENRMVVCPRCDGLGTLDMDAVRDEVVDKRRKAVIRTCPECEGQGRVNQSGDAEARKLVLEVAGIAGKKGPVVDARSVHYGHGVFSVEHLVKSMESAEQPMLDDPTIVDAEGITE